jgi:predicted PhzF superfamily epimerase YddE/YHI9
MLPQAHCGYTQNVITSLPSPSSLEDSGEYIYRMFSPHLPGGEDPVCGSAQCLLAPYWHSRKQLEKGQEIRTFSVSARRGVVDVVWAPSASEGKEDAVLLKGTTAFLGKGECYF